MFAEIAASLYTPFRSSALYGFTPFADIDNRDSWDAIDTDIRRSIIEEGEKYLHFDYPFIPITSFLDFKRSGNRVRFENVYFERRRVLNALVMAECVENSGRFMDDIINGIFALCEESGWQLPAHNSYERSSPQLPLPDNSRPVLDLFACETGAQLAMVHYLLKSRFDKLSPEISRRIHSELLQRVINPYFDSHFWWMGDGDEPMCNWTVWCVQNCLITIFLTEGISTEQKHSAICKASYSIDCFLKDYGEDGCCSEGAGYYHHAALCLFNAMEVLNAVTGDAYAGLYKNEKIKNIALYIYNVHVDDVYFINYADCSPIAGRAGVREYLFAKRINSPQMMAFAASDYKASSVSVKLLTEEINLFYHVQNAFTANELLSYPSHSDAGLSSNEGLGSGNAGIAMQSHIYYASNGLFITRDATYTLSAKAGNNADSHNHNDVGSITLYKNGLPYLIDVGVESYNARTFSNKRYEIWTMQSQYHNTPTFGNVMQMDGEDYCARVIDVSDNSITMDIAGAYPACSGVKTYKRKVSLDHTPTGSCVMVCDQYEHLPSGSFMTLMVYNKPVLKSQDPLSADNMSSIQVTEMGCIDAVCYDEDCISTAPEVIIDTLPVTDARLSQAWKHEIYRIRIYLSGCSLKLTIS